MGDPRSDPTTVYSNGMPSLVREAALGTERRIHMSVVLIVLLAVVGGGVALWWLRRPAPPPVRPVAAALPQAAPRSAPAEGSGGDAATVPAGLRIVDPRFVCADQLPSERQQALLQELRAIPRPPQALHQLVSPAFLARASSNELAELVMGEPVVAAKVMATVNSPIYGVRQSVTSIGQAITFLGLNCVRSLALHYMLNEALPTQDARLRRVFDTLARTSTVATELCLHLAKRLRLPDAAGLATQLVLASLGRQAAAVLSLRGGGDAAALDAGSDGMTRVATEQQRLGLSSGEIGHLLMREWGLPDAMAADTRDLGRIAFAAAPSAGMPHAARLAVGALSAVLAERLARGELDDLAAYDLARDESEEVRALRRHLPLPMAEQAAEALRAPELGKLVGKG